MEAEQEKNPNAEEPQAILEEKKAENSNIEFKTEEINPTKEENKVKKKTQKRTPFEKVVDDSLKILDNINNSEVIFFYII